MAESYANLFGTNGSGKRNRIGSMFGQQEAQQPQGQQQPQQPRPVQPMRQVQPQQTFAQMQQQGQARPAPPAPTPQAYAPYQGSQQAMQARTQMLGNLQQQLAQPTRFDTQAFQQIRGAQAANLQSEFTEQQRQLNEELARRGLSASTIGAAGMGRLAGAQSRALADLDAQLLQQAAQTQAQDRLAALQAGGQFAELAGAQDLADFEARRVGQAQQFQEGLAAAQFGQGQSEFDRRMALDAAQLAQQGGLSQQELALRQMLGLGELTGQVGGQQTLAAGQQAEQRRQFDIQQALQQQLGLGGLDIQRGQLGVEQQRLQQQAADTAAERQLREAMQTRELTAQETQQLRDITSRQQLQTQQIGAQQAESAAERDIRIRLQAGQISAEQAQQERQIAAQQALQTQQLSLQRAAQLTQSTGQVHDIDENGNVVPKTINGQPVSSESALARLDERRMREAELTGSYKRADGVSVDTLAAQRFGQERMNDLAQRAAQQSQLTGVMHKVDANGNIVREVDAENQPVSTEARRAQMVQEFNTTRQQAMMQAEARSQQTGLSFIVDSNGNVVADVDPVTNQQRTTAQAAQFNAQLQQQKDLAAAELSGFISINGVQVPTIAAQRLGQEKLQVALQQAQQMSQMTGLVYRVNDAGDVEPTEIRTESSLARLDARRLQEAELTGKYTNDNGVTIETIAAKQLDQNRLNQLAEQALRQSQVTGVMYKVDANGNIVQELDGNNQPISTESRRAQQVQESNVNRQLAQARADALSQQSGLSYTVDAAGNVVPDIDPATRKQRTTTQAQQLAQQDRQFLAQQAQQESQFGRTLGETALDRELRERLGLGQMEQQQRQFQLQLAAALSGMSEEMQRDLMAIFSRMGDLGTGSGSNSTPPPVVGTGTRREEDPTKGPAEKGGPLSDQTGIPDAELMAGGGGTASPASLDSLLQQILFANAIQGLARGG